MTIDQLKGHVVTKLSCGLYECVALTGLFLHYKLSENTLQKRVTCTFGQTVKDNNRTIQSQLFSPFLLVLESHFQSLTEDSYWNLSSGFWKVIQCHHY